MSAEIVNLRRARKSKARSGKERQAAENRAVHGRSKAERLRHELDQDRVRRELDGAQRTIPDVTRSTTPGATVVADEPSNDGK